MTQATIAMKGLRERILERAATSQLEDADAADLRDFYQSVLDSVGSVVYTVNRDLRITGVNQQWDDFALVSGGEHLTSERILGTDLLDQMAGPPLERWQTVCQQLLDGELERYLDEVASEQPFAWRHYSLRATPLRDSLGEILGITFVATNITQLKKAEHEMFQRLVEIRGLSQVAHTTGSWVDRRQVFKQVTSDIAHLFSADKCVIFLWDELTGDMQAKAPAFGLSGRKLEELSLDMGHPEDADSLWLDLEERDYILLNEGADAPPDIVATSAQVDRLAAMLGILRVSARVHGAILVAGREHSFTDQEGRLLALFAVPTALSIENAELNQRLLDRNERLAMIREQLDGVIRVKEAMRRPLGLMRGYLELLCDGAMGPVPTGQQPIAQLVLEKTRAVISLINRIPPTRLLPGAMRSEQVCLADVVRAVLDRRLASIKTAGLEIAAQLPVQGDADSFTLGDSEQLARAFDGLLDNAVKFSPDGGSVSVSLHFASDTLYLDISDSGVGMDADQLATVWEATGRTPPDAINLLEVRRIVEAHGGQIWAESTLGKGSTFHVAFRRIDH